MAAFWYDVWSRSFGKSWEERSWAASVGVSLSICTYLYASLLPLLPELQPIHLLMALHYLRVAPSLDDGANFFRCDRHTYHKYVWLVIDFLGIILQNIHMEDRLHDPDPWLGAAFLILDGKFCPIECNRKRWDFQRLFYSGKHKRWGLKYEVGVHWLTGQLHWIAGGVYGKVHDLTLARNSGILLAILPNERLYADKGYIGDPEFITPVKGRSANLPLADVLWNKLVVNPLRVVVENALGRICKFEILTKPFTAGNDVADRIPLHRKVFNVCAQLAQLDIRENPLRRDILENPGVTYADPESDGEE